MRHTNPQAACILCQEQIARVPEKDENGYFTTARLSKAKEMQRKHRAAISRSLYIDELRSWGLKKNRCDGHWE